MVRFMQQNDDRDQVSPSRDLENAPVDVRGGEAAGMKYTRE